MPQHSRGRRRGNVFPIRIAPEVRAMLELACSHDSGPKRLGPWLIWRALVGNAAPAGQYPRALGTAVPGGVIPELGQYPPRLGTTSAGAGNTAAPEPPIAERLIVDLCAGSGAWSEPYRVAGYRVRRITLPAGDVRTLPAFTEPVWGVLAAPPCTEFSLAKNGQERDFQAGLEVVSACLRLIVAARPQWWALENPVGYLSRFLGTPRDSFEPYEFGDPWSKRTAIWGDFRVPNRGPFVRAIDGGGPLCSTCHPDSPRTCSVSDHRAVTPAGFARAFCEANP